MSNQPMSRQDEEAHLEKTLAVVRSNVESYGREVDKMQADIDEMLDHYHDNDAEVYIILNNTITLHDHMKRALARNEKALSKPSGTRNLARRKTFTSDGAAFPGIPPIRWSSTGGLRWQTPTMKTALANAAIPPPQAHLSRST